MDQQFDTRTNSGQSYTMRELNQHTAQVLSEINENGLPAVITRRGRVIAVITPVADEAVESAMIRAALESAETSAQLRGLRTGARALTPEEAAEELHVNLPRT